MCFENALSIVVLRHKAVLCLLQKFSFKTALDFSRKMLDADRPQASTGCSAVFAKIVFAAGALGWASALGYCFWHYYFQSEFSYGEPTEPGSGTTISMPCFRGTGGTCWFMPCFGWHGNVTCYQGQCLCEANTCAGPDGICYRVDDWERNVVARGVKFLTANDSRYLAISENSNFMALTADEENASNFTVFSLPGVDQYGKVMVAASDVPSLILSTKILRNSCADHRSLQHYDADQTKARVQSNKSQSFSPLTNGAGIFGGRNSESEWSGYHHVESVSWVDWWRINWFAGKHLDGIGYDGMPVKHEQLALRSIDDSALPFDDRVALKLAWVDQPSGTMGIQFQSVLQPPEYLPCMNNLSSWSHTCLSAGTGGLAVSQLGPCGLLPHSRWQTQPRLRLEEFETAVSNASSRSFTCLERQMLGPQDTPLGLFRLSWVIFVPISFAWYACYPNFAFTATN